jgi:hypothetical protein
MSNLLIAIILVIILFPGTKSSDWRIELKDVPWWFLVTAGFITSLLGLFYWNDDRVIFAGCGLLFIAKVMSKIEERRSQENSEAGPGEEIKA